MQKRRPRQPFFPNCTGWLCKCWSSHRRYRTLQALRTFRLTATSKTTPCNRGRRRTRPLARCAHWRRRPCYCKMWRCNRRQPSTCCRWRKRCPRTRRRSRWSSCTDCPPCTWPRSTRTFRGGRTSPRRSRGSRHMRRLPRSHWQRRSCPRKIRRCNRRRPNTRRRWRKRWPRTRRRSRWSSCTDCPRCTWRRWTRTFRGGRTSPRRSRGSRHMRRLTRSHWQRRSCPRKIRRCNRRRPNTRRRWRKPGRRTRRRSKWPRCNRGRPGTSWRWRKRWPRTRRRSRWSNCTDCPRCTWRRSTRRFRGGTTSPRRSRGSRHMRRLPRSHWQRRSCPRKIRRCNRRQPNTSWRWRKRWPRTRRRSRWSNCTDCPRCTWRRSTRRFRGGTTSPRRSRGCRHMRRLARSHWQRRSCPRKIRRCICRPPSTWPRSIRRSRAGRSSRRSRCCRRTRRRAGSGSHCTRSRRGSSRCIGRPSYTWLLARRRRRTRTRFGSCSRCRSRACPRNQSRAHQVH